MTRTLLVAAAGALLVAAAPVAAHAQAATPATPASYRAPGTPGDSAKGPAEEGRIGLLTLDRESFVYMPDGRRDPFRSLMAIGELRPMVSDLRLSAVFYDAAGSSMAVLEDLTTREKYRVREGQQVGRMRIAAIRQKHVVFTIEEFGFSRQETLALGDPTTPRTQQ